MTLSKFIRSILLTTFILSGTPAFAETSSNSTPAGSLAKNTVTLAQDTAITTYIYAKIASKSDLANDNIDVSTSNGKVILNGLVNSNDEAQSVTQLAQATTGVKAVDASKLIIANPTNSMYIKTASASSQSGQPNNANQINPEQPGGIQIQAQQEVEPLAANANNPQKDQALQMANAASAEDSQPALSDQVAAAPVKSAPPKAKAKAKHHAALHGKGKKQHAYKKHGKTHKHSKKVALKKVKFVKTAHKAHKLPIQRSAHKKARPQTYSA